MPTALPTAQRRRSPPGRDARRPAAAPHAVRRAAGPVPAAAGRRPRARGPDRAVPDPGSLPPAAGPAARSARFGPGPETRPMYAGPTTVSRKIPLWVWPAVACLALVVGMLGGLAGGAIQDELAARPGTNDNGHQRRADADRRPAGGRQRLGRRGGAGAAAQHRPDRGRARRTRGRRHRLRLRPRPRGPRRDQRPRGRLRGRGRRPDRRHRPPGPAARGDRGGPQLGLRPRRAGRRGRRQARARRAGRLAGPARRRPRDRLRRPARA